MSAATRMTGAVAALLVLLGVGLFGQAGWLAALVLAAVTGALLGGVLHWLVDQGPAAMDGAAFAPQAGLGAQPTGPVADPQPSQDIAAPPSGDMVAPAAARAVPEAGRSIYPAAAADPDDLRAIRGVGEKVEAALLDAGITRFAQIAAWDEAQIDAVAPRIGRAAGRIRSEDWVGQARALASRREEA